MLKRIASAEDVTRPSRSADQGMPAKAERFQRLHRMSPASVLVGDNNKECSTRVFGELIEQRPQVRSREWCRSVPSGLATSSHSSRRAGDT
jgi:hypothetical protein